MLKTVKLQKCIFVSKCILNNIKTIIKYTNERCTKTITSKSFKKIFFYYNRV